jgi:hypothetical protein
VHDEPSIYIVHDESSQSRNPADWNPPNNQQELLVSGGFAEKIRSSNIKGSAALFKMRLMLATLTQLASNTSPTAT